MTRQSTDLRSEAAGTLVLLGGSGFIGSAIARRLTGAGARIRIADLRPSPIAPLAWMNCDVRQAQSVAIALDDATTVFLLAAEHGLAARPSARYEETNIGGARAVADAARRTGVRRIVFTSTVAVYGAPGVPRTEASRCLPTTDYGRTKLAAELELRCWAAEDPTRSLVIIRPTVVFGSGGRGQNLGLFQLMAQPGFRMVGHGANRKSFANCENLAAFQVHVSTLGPGVHLFNYADGPDLTLAELAAVIRGALELPAAAPSQSRAMAVVRAVMGRLRRSTDGAPPALSVAQVRRLCADSRYLSEHLAQTGFVAPRTLGDALAEYAWSDLRYIAQRSVPTPTGTSVAPGDVPAA